MKYLRTLGLAAIAALGLMVFVGAGTASATTLATDSCGCVKYGAGTGIYATLESGTSTALTDTSGNTIATCTGSQIGGTTNNESGTSVSVNVSTLTWEGCNQTTDTIFSGTFEIARAIETTGTFDSNGSDVTLQIFGVSCTYGTFGTSGTISEGSVPTVRITDTMPKAAGGFLCPSTAIWHAAYIVTEPHALYINP